MGSTTLSGTAGLSAQGAATVVVQDGSGTPLQGVTVTFAVTAGGGALTGATPQTDAQGQATLGDWTLGTVAGQLNSVTATVAGLPTVSFTATPVAGPATALVLTTAPSAVATSGAAFATQPVVQATDLHGNAVAQAGLTVTAAIQSGGGTVSAGSTAVTDANGTATFSGLTVTGTPGTRVLVFSAPAFTSVLSGTITLNGGPPTTIAATQGNNQTADAGTAVPVLLKRW
ncbi:MAG: Ig-like domain-containing protein [Gemmatimonadetes bacterium]|nr:Ig-like domain-containing protein [Gemmatimonadota bacterium]